MTEDHAPCRMKLMRAATLRPWQSISASSPGLPPPSPLCLISPLALPKPSQPLLQLALPLPALVYYLFLSLIITKHIVLLSTVEDVSKEVCDSLSDYPNYQLISALRTNLLVDLLISLPAPPVPSLCTPGPLSCPAARALPDSPKTYTLTLSCEAATTTIPPH